MSTHFQMTRSEMGSATSIVFVQGELDLQVAPELQQQLLLVADRPSDVVVDLSGVTFIDSTILGVLVRCASRLRARHGDLELVVTDPNIRKILLITGLDRMFRIYSSVDEAMFRLNGAA